MKRGKHHVEAGLGFILLASVTAFVLFFLVKFSGGADDPAPVPTEQISEQQPAEPVITDDTQDRESYGEENDYVAPPSYETKSAESEQNNPDITQEEAEAELKRIARESLGDESDGLTISQPDQ